MKDFCLEQEADLIRKHSEDETRCAGRVQHLTLLQAVNKREFEVRDLIHLPIGISFLGIC